MAEETTALFEPAPRAFQRCTLVWTHGVGGHMTDRSALALATNQRGYEFDLVRLNFLCGGRRSGCASLPYGAVYIDPPDPADMNRVPNEVTPFKLPMRSGQDTAAEVQVIPSGER